MERCEYCNKEVKSLSGLKRHLKTCKVKDEQLVEEEVKVSSVASTELTYIQKEKLRRIDKLKVSINMCYDAETKYRLECELKDLESRD